MGVGIGLSCRIALLCVLPSTYDALLGGVTRGTATLASEQLASPDPGVAAATAVGPAVAACLEVLSAAASVAGGADTIGPNVIFEQCQRRGGWSGSGNRASGGDSTTAGADEECHELARLYSLARHYSGNGNGNAFSASGFCAAAEDSGLDAATSSTSEDADAVAAEEHRVCSVGLNAALASPAVGDAAVAACVSASGGAGRTVGTVEEDVSVACQRYVAAFMEASSHAGGAMDISSFCSGLLSRSAAIGGGVASNGVTGADSRASAPTGANLAGDEEEYSTTSTSGRRSSSSSTSSSSSSSSGATGTSASSSAGGSTNGESQKAAPVGSGLAGDSHLTAAPDRAPAREEEQFVAACARYAGGVISNLAIGAATESAAVDVQRGCEAQLGAGLERGFCEAYADLVRRRAAPDEVEDYCYSQFEAMRAKDAAPFTSSRATSAATSPLVAPTTNSVLTRGTVAAAVLPPNGTTTSVAAPQMASMVACEQYLASVEKLDLPSDEAAKVVELDCPKRFHFDANFCVGFARSYSAGDAQGACRMVATAHHGPDMVTTCRRTVEKVVAIGLSGAALERAAADVCGKEVTNASMTAGSRPPPESKVRQACQYLAKHLAQNQGDPATFCSHLTARRRTAQTAPKVDNAAPATPVQPTFAPQNFAPPPVARIAESSTASIPAVSQAGGQQNPVASQTASPNNGTAGDSMSSFLDHFDAQGVLAPAKRLKMQETQHQADALFGSPLPPGPRVDLGAAIAPVPSLRGSVSPKAIGVAIPPPGKGRRPVQTSFVDETTAGEAAPTAAIVEQGDADIDALVASFAAEQSG